jgi:hypothetical protein
MLVLLKYKPKSNVGLTGTFKACSVIFNPYRTFKACSVIFNPYGLDEIDTD